MNDGGTIALNKKILSAETVRRVQTRLKAEGFDPGPVDGKFGPQTLRALRAYQKAKKLAPDGIVGPNTLRKLGLK
jgi:peptidoglycan hydrolase-like protein with peptidoglycan-binding domain